MNRIDRRFEELKARDEKALVCFLTGGDPDFETTEKLVCAIARAGADIVEIGVPFSDPLADGPSIQASSYRALQAGATVKGVFDSVRRIREECDVPIVLMTYYNPVQKYGVEKFARDAAACGADGAILTDLPPEEANEWKTAADEFGLATVFLLAPTSTEERIALGAKSASGFIYCVSRTGVTGAREDVPMELSDLVGRIKSRSRLPVVVGFGISKPEHVARVFQFADGAVVGSALVDIIADHHDRAETVERAARFVQGLKEGVASRE